VQSFLIATQPIDSGKTLCEGIVFAPRSSNAFLRAVVDPIALAIRRFFTHGYLKDEASRLLGTRYSPATMIEHDADMIAYFNWVAALPQHDTNCAHDNGAATTLDRSTSPNLFSNRQLISSEAQP